MNVPAAVQLASDQLRDQVLRFLHRQDSRVVLPFPTHPRRTVVQVPCCDRLVDIHELTYSHVEPMTDGIRHFEYILSFGIFRGECPSCCARYFALRQEEPSCERIEVLAEVPDDEPVGSVIAQDRPDWLAWHETSS